MRSDAYETVGYRPVCEECDEFSDAEIVDQERDAEDEAIAHGDRENHLTAVEEVRSA